MKAMNQVRKRRRIEQPEQPAEGVVARDAVLQHQKFLQKALLQPAEQRHVGTRLAAAQHRAQRDQHHLMQRVTLGVPGSRIVQILEQLREILHDTASLPVGATP